MPDRRRRPAIRRRRPMPATAAAATPRTGVESLEPRRLMTTLSAPVGQVESFPYTDEAGQPMMITYSGVTFEAIADGGGFAENMVPFPLPSGAVGANLFKLYITDATAESSISVSLFNPTNGALLPYSGNSGVTGTVNTNGAPYTVDLPYGSVTVGLGVPPLTTAPETSFPLVTSFGLQPAPESGVLTGGIEMATVSPTTGLQNDLGNLLIGGSLFGSVYLGGNVNEFYAGAVMTGGVALGPGGLVNLRTPATPTTAPLAAAQPTVTTGGTTTAGATPAALANFTVTGDLRSFQTLGTVGTDGAGTPAQPLYVTDFAMTVGGQLGQMRVGHAQLEGEGAFAGTVQVYHNQNIASGVAPTGGYTPQEAAEIGTTLYNPGIETPQLETEVLTPTTVGPGQGFGQPDPNTGLLTYDLRNAEFDPDVLADGAGVRIPSDAQILTSTPELSETSGLPIFDANGNEVYNSVVDGELQGTVQGYVADQGDNYAMAFQAGQTFTVAVAAATAVSLTIVDPDGRIIASNTESGQTPIQVVPDRPGLYYFEVGETTTADTPYVLTVTGTGDLGLGGITANGAFFNDDGFDQGLVVHQGDLGCLDVENDTLSSTYASLDLGPTASNSVGVLPKAATTIGVYAGSLRTVQADAIGIRSAANPAILADGPTLNVPFGGVGLVRSMAGVLDLVTQEDLTALALPTPEQISDTANATAIGGNVQVIDADTTAELTLFTNGSIGTIRAGDFATDDPSYIDINADNSSTPAEIDLIDCAGNFGDPTGGGPELVTNDGGQVRYLRVGGQAFDDSLFGGEEDPVTGAVGAAATFVDQAGNRVTVTPDGLTTYQSSTGTGATTVATGPQITTLLYPVRDKSGYIPILVSSSQGLTVAAAGTAGNNAELDIGQVTINTADAVGRPIQATGADDKYGNAIIAQQTSSGTISTTGANAATSTQTSTALAGGAGLIGIDDQASADAQDIYAQFTGPATVNVLGVTVDGSIIVNTGNAAVIENDTRGEIASVVAPAVGAIRTAGNLGFTTAHATPAAVLPRAIIAQGDASNGGGPYPFDQVHTGVVIGTGITYNPTPDSDEPGEGDLVQAIVGGGVANLEVGGTLQTLVANAFGQAPVGQLDGIDGPIVATDILNVNVGQGMAFRGTGDLGGAGLYAVDEIGSVSNNNNPGAVIRGEIVAGTVQAPGNSAIGLVQLVNGSLVDARIEVLGRARFDEGTPFGAPEEVGIGGQSASATPFVYNVGGISVSGAGGIIGTNVEAQSIGPVLSVNGAFGILQSQILAAGSNGRIQEVVASGYGIHDSDIFGGGYLGPITANGNGAVVPTSAYPLSVRPSDTGNQAIDPAIGMYPDVDNDINAVLGVIGGTEPEADVTDTGVIEDDIIEADRDFAGLTAHRARTALPLFSTFNNTAANQANIPVQSVQFANSVSVGGTMGLLRIYDTVDGLQVTAGHLQKVLLSNNVNRLGIAVAGPIDNFVVHGNLGQTITDPVTAALIPDSYVRATGPAGTLTQFQVYGSLFADVVATGRIGTMTVTGDVSGTIEAQGNVNGTNPRIPAYYSVNTLRVGGGIKDGSVQITGRVNNLIVNGGLGSAGGTFDIAGSVNNLSVGAGHKPGSVLGTALTVGGTVNKLSVYGRITGSVTVQGDLRSLQVTDDGTAADAVSGPITVTGRLFNAAITGGNLGGNLTVTGDLYNLAVNRGSIDAGITVSSTLSSVHTVRVTGGDLDGSVVANNGSNLSVTTTGSFGNGTTAATITARSANTISIGGGVRGGAAVSIDGTLNSLSVGGGGIAAGGSVVGNPIRRHVVRGPVTGTLTTA